MFTQMISHPESQIHLADSFLFISVIIKLILFDCHKVIHYQDPPLFYDLWKSVLRYHSCRLVLWVCLIHLSVYVYWIRMAQNRLVNYRHLLSKRGMCCQVLQHEVGLVLRGEKAEPGVELHGRRLCHVLLECLSSPCPSSESSSVMGIFTLTSRI